VSYRVLVTAGGGTLAPLNIRLMKESRRHAVWVLAVDTRADAGGRYFADAFAQVPAGTDGGYVDAIVREIELHNIDLVLPWSDEEALALAAQRTRIEQAGAVLACADLAVLQTMSDKAKTYEVLDRAGIAMPAWQQVHSVTELELAVQGFAKESADFVVKPSVARGNRGTIVIRSDVGEPAHYLGSRELHMNLDSFRRDYMSDVAFSAVVMERLFPPAFDIDVLAQKGTMLRAMPRRRLNPAGIPFTGGVLVPRPELLTLADRITAALSLSWLYDYDLMSTRAGMPVPIELNPRPSGSIAAAILAGVPFYDDLISLAKGEPLQDIAMPGEIAVIPFTDCKLVPVDALA
jgi:carbamoyl-phosphate synthase large subunit